MGLLYIVLGFLVPVIMVFAYSVWLHRRRVAADAKLASDPDNKAFAELVQRCSALKTAATTDNVTNIEEDINSVLVVARSLQDQDMREASLSHAMGVYLAIGRDEEAHALLAEVKKETNRARILKNVFGKVT